MVGGVSEYFTKHSELSVSLLHVMLVERKFSAQLPNTAVRAICQGKGIKSRLGAVREVGNLPSFASPRKSFSIVVAILGSETSSGVKSGIRCSVRLLPKTCFQCYLSST